MVTLETRLLDMAKQRGLYMMTLSREVARKRYGAYHRHGTAPDPAAPAASDQPARPHDGLVRRPHVRLG